MNWDLGRLAAKTFQKYLEPLLDSRMKVYVAYTNDAIQYPCVDIKYLIRPYSPESGWNKYKTCLLELVLMTEAVDQVDATGKVIMSYAEIHTQYLNSVLTGLCDYPYAQDPPVELLTLICAAAIPGVAFSMALVGDWEPGEETQGSLRVFKTTIHVETIVEPVRIQ